VKNFQVIKNAISYELANFIFKYFILKRDAVGFLHKKGYYPSLYDPKNNTTYDTDLLGTWKDSQVSNTFCCYADLVMETLLINVLPKVQQETGLQLIPTYSYARLYKRGDKLRRHRDRPSCEISTTLNIGGHPWPIFIDGTGTKSVIDGFKEIHKPNAPKGTKVLLEVGDILIYNGHDLEHWREPLEGEVCGQVFLHYNDANGPFTDKNKFDNRPILGIPQMPEDNSS